MSLVFFIPMNIPAGTAQMKGARIVQPRGKKPFITFYKTAVAVAAEKVWHASLYQYRPAVPFAGPVRLTLNFVYPWRQTEKKSIMEKFDHFPIQTRPDVENVAKGCIDVMQTLRFFNDDSQIASLTLTKNYADVPGLGVILTPAFAETRMGTKVEISA